MEGTLGTEELVVQHESPSQDQMVRPSVVVRRLAQEVERRPCTETDLRDHKDCPLDAPHPQVRGADLGRLAHRVNAPGTLETQGAPWPYCMLCAGTWIRGPSTTHAPPSEGQPDGRTHGTTRTRLACAARCLPRATLRPEIEPADPTTGGKSPPDRWEKPTSRRGVLASWYEVQAHCPTHVLKALT